MPRDAPRAWRSSFVERDIPTLPPNVVWGQVDAAILLARHIVPARTIAVVRRITAHPFRLVYPTDPQDPITVDFPTTPDWWNTTPNIVKPRFPEAWDWGWNVGHYGVDRRTRAQFPGAVVVSQLNRIKEALSYLGFELNDKWQRLSDGGALTMHGTDSRFIVEGPQVVQLWAIVTLDKYIPAVPPEPIPPIPFASSFGAMEGIDVPVDRWLDNPAQWLIP